MQLKAVFGLGNPGGRYQFTRHNIGAECVVAYLKQFHPKAKFFEDGYSLVSTLDNCLCVLPQTYMNLSGIAVEDCVTQHRLQLRDCLVIYDDASIPFGQLRIRKSGGAGGQNGMKSVIEHLQSKDIARLRVGVGAPQAHLDLAKFVLEPFDKDEQAQLPLVLKTAAESIQCFIHDGVETAMNRFNGEAISE